MRQPTRRRRTSLNAFWLAALGLFVVVWVVLMSKFLGAMNSYTKITTDNIAAEEKAFLDLYKDLFIPIQKPKKETIIEERQIEPEEDENPNEEEEGEEEEEDDENDFGEIKPLTSKDIGEIITFWTEMQDVKPAEPFLWFPLKDVSNTRRNSGLKRTIFCATSGHTGTKLLTKILKTCPGVYSIHEPKTVDLSIAGPYLWMTNEFPMNETFKNRSHKLDLIKEGLQKGEIYAETSNMFIKTFYDIVLADESLDVDIVILRRNLPKVFRSHMIILGLYDFVGDLVAEQYINTTFSVNGVHKPAVPFPMDHATRVMRYIVDIEARTQKLYNEYKDSPRVHFLNSTLDEIINNPEHVEWLIKSLDLGYVKDSARKATASNLNRKRVSRCTADMNLTVAKQMCYDYFTRIQSKDLIIHPGMKAMKTFDNKKEKVVSAVYLDSQCPLDGQGFARFIKDTLQYSEHLFVLGDPNSCPLYQALVFSHESYVTTLTPEDGGVENLIDEITKSGATHVVSVAPGNLLSKDFTNSSLLRQFVLSLEPGEALDVFSLDTEEYVPLAFALNTTGKVVRNANTNVLTLQDAHHYKVLPGINLPGYPSYFIHKSKIFN